MFKKKVNDKSNIPKEVSHEMTNHKINISRRETRRTCDHYSKTSLKQIITPKKVRKIEKVRYSRSSNVTAIVTVVIKAGVPLVVRLESYIGNNKDYLRKSLDRGTCTCV